MLLLKLSSNERNTEEIQDGSFAKEFVKNVGDLPAKRETQRNIKIEQVGESLRSMMPWIKKIVDKSKN